MPDKLTLFFGLLAELEWQGVCQRRGGPGLSPTLQRKAKEWDTREGAIRQPPDGQAERVGPLLSGLEGSIRDRRKEVIQSPGHLRYLRHFVRHERAGFAGVDAGSTQDPTVAATEQAVRVRADRRLRRSAGKHQRVEPSLQRHVVIRWSRPELPESPA